MDRQRKRGRQEYHDDEPPFRRQRRDDERRDRSFFGEPHRGGRFGSHHRDDVRDSRLREGFTGSVAATPDGTGLLLSGIATVVGTGVGVSMHVINLKQATTRR